jgi:hypothetical protein
MCIDLESNTVHDVIVYKYLNTSTVKPAQNVTFFSSPCQRQCELLPSLGIRCALTFHILIFSSETP